MRYKILMLLLMCVGMTWGQETYQYENLTVNAESHDGEVKWNGHFFELQDSCVQIELTLYERKVSTITVRNKSQYPIIARWKSFSASNDTFLWDLTKKEPKKYRRYYNNSYLVSVRPPYDARSGEETIYADGLRTYYFQWTTRDMFPRKLETVKGEVLLCFVINGREMIYLIDLTGINSMAL